MKMIDLGASAGKITQLQCRVKDEHYKTRMYFKNSPHKTRRYLLRARRRPWRHSRNHRAYLRLGEGDVRMWYGSSPSLRMAACSGRSPSILSTAICVSSRSKADSKCVQSLSHRLSPGPVNVGAGEFLQMPLCTTFKTHFLWKVALSSKLVFGLSDLYTELRQCAAVLRPLHSAHLFVPRSLITCSYCV